MTNCKVCGAKSELYGLCDFSKNCGDLDIPLTGTPVYYHKCPACGLIFTTKLDAWYPEEFKEYIYNDEYAKFDPDYLEVRPQYNSEWLPQYLGGNPGSILDYGGGNGRTAELLRERDYDCVSWDPFSGEPKPDRKFDTVYSIEVFEHTTDPVGTLKEALSFLKPGGKLIFTTLVNNDLKPKEMHWYISPRNGHVLMHSYESIDKLCGMMGLKVNHINNSLHICEYND